MINKLLSGYIDSVIEEFDQIKQERKKDLEKIAHYVASKINNNNTVKLVFICTHNSRRSHMGQIWAKAAAYHYSIPDVETYSGGTEATAFNPNAVQAMKEAGFIMTIRENGHNPVYEVVYADDSEPLSSYSKKFDSEDNPRNDFCAVMTCSQADQNCPFIPGASLRVSIPYDDPKEFDGTTQEKQAYLTRTRQIGREMMYLFSRVST